MRCLVSEVVVATGGMSPLSTRLLRPDDPADCAVWNAFVYAHPAATFFHRAEWAQVLVGVFGHTAHYLLAEQAGEVVGVLPLAEMRSWLFGKTLVSTPFCVYGGVLAWHPEAQVALETAAVILGERLGVAHIEFRNSLPQRDDWQRKDLYVTFRKTLAVDDEAELSAIPRKARAEVRKGQKNGLSVTIERDPATWYTLFSESLRNLGTPVFTSRYAQTLLDIFGADCEILTLRAAGTPLTSVLSFYFRGEVLPYYGGGGAAARSTGAHDLMYYEVMRRARALGCTSFDFGRSKRETGSYAFKKNLGFEPTPLAYEYRLVRAKQMPNLSSTNTNYTRIIQAWQRLPLWVSRVVGPPLARHLW
jgi:FemAB-related protein (PEP-CTERM system-associated)